MSEGSHLTIDFRQRAVNAVLGGMTKTAVASAYGVDRKTITRWANRFQEGGGDALLRQVGSGRRRKLEDLAEEELLRIVLGGAAAYDFETNLWTVGRLRRVIADEFQIQVSKNTVWRRLRDAGLTYQKPEREYYEIDEASRKKWLRYEVPKIRRAVTKHRGILYFQDDSNISLTAFLGKTWSPCGQTRPYGTVYLSFPKVPQGQGNSPRRSSYSFTGPSRISLSPFRKSSESRA